MTDNELLDLLRTYPEKGFDNLLKQYTGLVYTIVFSKLSSVCTREDAEECVSDIFVEFYNRTRSYEFELRSMKAYLTVLAKRNAVDRFRRATAKGNAELISIDDDDNNLTELRSDADVAASVVEKERNRLVMDAVYSLGEPDSAILIRKFFYGETDKQIAGHINMTKNAVNKRIHRSLDKLKTILGGVF